MYAFSTVKEEFPHVNFHNMKKSVSKHGYYSDNDVDIYLAKTIRDKRAMNTGTGPDGKLNFIKPV